MNKVFKYVGILAAFISLGIISYLGFDVISRGDYTNTDLTILALNSTLLSVLLK